MARIKSKPKSKENYILNVGPQGRIVIPAPIRKSLDLKAGDRVVGILEGDKIILKPAHIVERELWSMFNKAKFSSKELISERRKEARKEAQGLRVER